MRRNACSASSCSRCASLGMAESPPVRATFEQFALKGLMRGVLPLALPFVMQGPCFQRAREDAARKTDQRTGAHPLCRARPFLTNGRLQEGLRPSCESVKKLPD